ncbi:MAG: toll/interleukin-1 receptor domain-containing protein [Gammaproteobacteria bacterium]|nr:toll/interleukin-1 receptor domain-containing protein [Gammaproteobacteria bacterium]
MKYRAFLSYSHANEDWARWIHRSLERYRVPKNIVEKKSLPSTRLKPVFLDRDELSSSNSLNASILEALTASEALIVICSPTAAKSKWVNQEIEEFRKLHGGENIFCCVVEGQAPDVFPPALLQSGEPLAADLTTNGDGRRAGFTKLVAGLLGVGFDDLKRREYQVRNRKLAAVALASLVGMAVMSYLGVSAILASRQAELARQDAEQRREQAEDLLAFMVGDLRKSLEPLGRLDLLDRVGDQATKYFESVEAEAINDRSLTLQSQVLTQIGEIRMSQFQYEAAVEAFEQAYRFAQPLVLRHPEDGEKLFRRSQAEFWIGYLRWRTGDLDGAQKWLQMYYDSSVQLTTIDPARDDWLQEVAWGHHNLGVLAVEQKDLSRARDLFGKELAVLIELSGRSPDVDETRENSADAYSWLGRISEREGDLEAALWNYKESARVREELLARSPDHSGRKLWFVVASAFNADMLAITGQTDKADSTYASLIPVLAELVEQDPEDRELKRYLSRVQVDVTALLTASTVVNGRSEGLTFMQQPIETLENLLEAENEDRRVRISLAKAYRVAATLYYLDKQFEPAAELAKRAIELVTGDLGDELSVQEFGAALVVATMTHGQVNGLLSATEIDRYRNLFEQASEQSQDPLTLDALARIAVLEGDTGRSKTIVSRLNQAGYVPIRPWPTEIR